MTGLSQDLLSKTGAALVVVTVKNLDGMSVEDYASRLFENGNRPERGRPGRVAFGVA